MAMLNYQRVMRNPKHPIMIHRQSRMDWIFIALNRRFATNAAGLVHWLRSMSIDMYWWQCTKSGGSPQSGQWVVPRCAVFIQFHPLGQMIWRLLRRRRWSAHVKSHWIHWSSQTGSMLGMIWISTLVLWECQVETWLPTKWVFLLDFNAPNPLL